MFVEVLNTQSLFDIAIQETRIADNAFEIAYVNNKSISDILAAATLVKIPDIFPVYLIAEPKPESYEYQKAIYTKALDHEASFFSLAFEASGTVENAFDLAYGNNRSISDILGAASLVNIPSVFPAYISTATRTEPVEVKAAFYIKTLESAACFFDLADACSGTVENAFDLAYTNNKSISDILAAASSVNIPALFPVYISTDRKTEAREAPETLYEFTVPYKSCFFDFSTDNTGETENAFKMAYNSFRSISDILQINDLILISSHFKSNRYVVNYYRKNNIKSASGINTILELYSIFDDTFDNTFN